MSKNKDLQDNLTQLMQTSDPKIRKIPPLERWQPTGRSPLDIAIMDNGDWWHEGVKMTRQSLVDLFASVLWVEADAAGQKTHYLKTPSDLYQIRVVDAPLFINRVEVVHSDGVAWLECITTNGDRFLVGDEHRPYFGFFGEEERLYVPVRFGLVARFLNNAFFHLMTMEGVEIDQDDDGKTVLKLASGGKIYEIVSALS